MFWPPSWPDCNALTHFVWVVSEFQVNKTSHNTTNSMVQNIKKVIGRLNRATVGGPTSGSVEDQDCGRLIVILLSQLSCF